MIDRPDAVPSVLTADEELLWSYVEEKGATSAKHRRVDGGDSDGGELLTNEYFSCHLNTFRSGSLNSVRFSSVLTLLSRSESGRVTSAGPDQSAAGCVGYAARQQQDTNNQTPTGGQTSAYIALPR